MAAVVCPADASNEADMRSILTVMAIESIAPQVRTVVEGDPVDLIETLAQRIADVCLAQPSVAEVEVTVHKPHAPIQATFQDVALTINRSPE